MTFDSEISETVSLSKILDSFLDEGEEPNIICTFLKQHETEFKDIIDNGLQSVKIFQIDFLNKLSYSNKIFIYRMMNKDNVDENISAIFVWQIFQSNIDEMTKNIFRPYLNQKIMNKNKYSKFHHPYSALKGKLIQELDCIFKDVNLSFDDIIYTLNRINDDKFNDLINCIDSSLWFGRMLQMDIFLSLSIQKQYIFLHNLHLGSFEYYHKIAIIKFYLQTLNSNIELGLKCELYNHIKSKHFEFNYNFISTTDELK